VIIFISTHTGTMLCTHMGSYAVPGTHQLQPLLEAPVEWNLPLLEAPVDGICEHAWSWMSLSQWQRRRHKEQQQWVIKRSGAPSATGEVEVSYEPDSNATMLGPVVMVESSDASSTNIWHRMTALFTAWLAPHALERMGVLPRPLSEAPAAYSSASNQLSAHDGWSALGKIVDESLAQSRARIYAPTDGFLWDLAWDLPLACSREPDLWRDFLSALRRGLRLPSFSPFGRRLCLVHRDGGERVLGHEREQHIAAAASNICLDGKPLQLVELRFNASSSLHEQAWTAQRCDILLGMHGSGMIHSLWMEPVSAVIEVMDKEHAAAAYYRNIAHLSGHVYFHFAQAHFDTPTQILRALFAAAEVVSNKGPFAREASMCDGLPPPPPPPPPSPSQADRREVEMAMRMQRWRKYWNQPPSHRPVLYG
jgi:hypothetical protein